jgi:carbonic anhydrase/acetyltransferase-like protein (isoleucine patch superfamily)
MALYEFDGARVTVPANGRYYVAENATVLGKVVIEEEATVWFGSVVRGDNEQIVIGRKSNVQDGCVLHTDPGFPLTIAAECTIGHMAMLHGCTIGRGSLIGIGAIVLNGARIGEQCIIGANALVAEGKEIPSGSVVLGSPGKIVRQINDKDLELIRYGVELYASRGRLYADTLKLQQAR